MNEPIPIALIFGMPGWSELLLLGVVGLLIFGKRLPDVGRSLGRGILEFKKGLSGIESDIDQAGGADQAGVKHSDPPQIHSSGPNGDKP